AMPMKYVSVPIHQLPTTSASFAARSDSDNFSSSSLYGLRGAAPNAVPAGAATSTAPATSAAVPPLSPPPPIATLAPPTTPHTTSRSWSAGAPAEPDAGCRPSTRLPALALGGGFGYILALVPARLAGGRRARSSAGEHYVDIVGVTGSIPVAPTTSKSKF